jgi:hypothetical protein
MIQDGNRGVAMGHAVAVRTDYTADKVRRLAKRVKDAAQARRLLAIAAVLFAFLADAGQIALENLLRSLYCGEQIF